MRLNLKKIGMATAALAIALSAAACNNSDGTPVTPQSAADSILAYACPIAIAVNASAAILTSTERVALTTAVADCNIYTTQGIAGLTSPAAVATAVVEVIFAVQGGASFTALAPSLQHRIIAGHHKLDLRLKAAGLGDAGSFVGSNLH